MYSIHLFLFPTAASSEMQNIFQKKAGSLEHILHIKNTLIIRAAISKIRF